MRISDWSSDVCSSDLGKPRHRIVHGKIVKAVEAGADAAEQPVQRIDKLGKLLALALVEGDVHFAFGGRADPHDQPVYCPGGLRHDPHGGAPAGDAADDAQDQRIAKLSRAAAMGCRRAHQHSEDEDDARSEEHTSELQSLMRISYAVFCLKKKK